MNWRIHKTTLVVGTLALLVTASEGHAQSVSLDNGSVEVFDTDGDSAVLIDNGANYTAGGNGRTATFNLRGSDGPVTLSYHAFQAQLILGGGTHEGILLLKDDDGVTTTIDLDGRTGGIRLGGNGEDGDLIVYDNTNTETFRVNGQSGSATNELSSNGLVKAWARINSDGTVLSCWRCDQAVSATFQLSTGSYLVDFSPLGPDIQSRPRTAIIDSHDTSVAAPGAIRLANSSPSTRVLVLTTDVIDGTSADRPFTVFVF